MPWLPCSSGRSSASMPTVFNTESGADLRAVGDFDVETVWPGKEPWGAGPDLYRTLDDWNSAYIKPVGERNQATFDSRWSSPEMDAIIKELRETDPFDTEKVVEVASGASRKPSGTCPASPPMDISALSAGTSITGPIGPAAKTPILSPIPTGPTSNIRPHS